MIFSSNNNGNSLLHRRNKRQLRSLLKINKKIDKYIYCNEAGEELICRFA